MAPHVQIKASFCLITPMYVTQATFRPTHSQISSPPHLPPFCLKTPIGNNDGSQNQPQIVQHSTILNGFWPTGQWVRASHHLKIWRLTTAVLVPDTIGRIAHKAAQKLAKHFSICFFEFNQVFLSQRLKFMKLLVILENLNHWRLCFIVALTQFQTLVQLKAFLRYIICLLKSLHSN